MRVKKNPPHPLPMIVPICCNQTVFMPHVTTLLQSDGSEATGTYWKQATVRRHQRLDKIARISHLSLWSEGSYPRVPSSLPTLTLRSNVLLMRVERYLTKCLAIFLQFDVPSVMVVCYDQCMKDSLSTYEMVCRLRIPCEACGKMTLVP